MRNSGGEPAPTGGRQEIFSVGHSNLEPAAFLALLRRFGITAIADVRSEPHSGRYPHFSRGPLEEALRRAGIAYVFLGDLLGGRPRDHSVYDGEGRVDYERVRQTEAFARGLDRLARGLDRHAVAMLCAEDDPLDCHRGLMIAPALGERGLFPRHIRKDGSVENTEEIERRLLREAGLGEVLEATLFPPTEEERRQWLVEAYRRLGRKKAYRLPADAAEE
jgi:uncharacterized protein (DUF488 family)